MPFSVITQAGMAGRPRWLCITYSTWISLACSGLAPVRASTASSAPTSVSRGGMAGSPL